MGMPENVDVQRRPDSVLRIGGRYCEELVVVGDRLRQLLVRQVEAEDLNMISLTTHSDPLLTYLLCKDALTHHGLC